MQLYIGIALYGSGIPFPIGVFDSKEEAERQISRLGHPTSKIILPVKLNENWELQRRSPEYQQSVLEQEARIKDLNEKGHLIRHKNKLPVHVTYDGLKTLCGRMIGKDWNRKEEDQIGSNMCYKCLRKNH